MSGGRGADDITVDVMTELKRLATVCEDWLFKEKVIIFITTF